MATKREKEALSELLDELEGPVVAWMDDTAYPRRSRIDFNNAVLNVLRTFGKLSEDGTRVVK